MPSYWFDEQRGARYPAGRRGSGLYYTCINSYLTAEELAFIVDGTGDDGPMVDYVAAVADQPTDPIPAQRLGTSMRTVTCASPIARPSWSSPEA